jgi:hypothetical protein
MPTRRCAVPSLLQDFCRTARTRRPWRGLTFADVLSAHPEILHPLSGTGRPAQLPRFDNCVKTNACIASDVRKHRFRCQKSITAYCCSFFHFRQAFLSSVLIAHVNNRQSRPLGKYTPSQARVCSRHPPR